MRLPASLLKVFVRQRRARGRRQRVVFLPQILILFFFILSLEESGYLRAPPFSGRVMGSVGLSGRAFIPLCPSFACAIPGIMATRLIQKSTRTAEHDHDRSVDDVLGSPAGVRAHHRRVISARRCGRSRIAGRGAVCALHRGIAAPWRRLRARRSGGGVRLHSLLRSFRLSLANLRNLGIGLWQRVEIS